MKKIVFLLIISFFTLECWLFSQPLAARIDFEIKGLNNTYITLGIEYFNKQLIIDTVRLNDKGEGSFNSPKRLETGIYVVSFPNKKFVEILVEDEQFFTFYTDTTDYFQHLTITGSSHSDLFIRYQKFMKVCKKNRNTQCELANQLKDSILKHMPSSFLASYLKLQDLFLIEKGKSFNRETFLQKQKNIEKSFLENFSFDDNRLLRTTLFYEQLSFFFRVFISQHPDTIISRMNIILNKAKKNSESYKYLLSFFNQNYSDCRTPIYEKVYVYLAENYYLNGKAPWANPKFLTMLEKKVEKLKESMIGAQAKDLILYTPNEKEIRLYDIVSEKVILFFWDPECTLCRDAYDKLLSVSQKYSNKQLQIIAVYMYSNKSPWLEYIKNHKSSFIHVYDPIKKNKIIENYPFTSLPYYYLLEKDKTILMKGNNFENIDFPK